MKDQLVDHRIGVLQSLTDGHDILCHYIHSIL